MIRQTYHIELITPCFCAGADPARAEIRAASIRGQLRWWFRVLGGNSAEEGSVFGQISQKQANSGAVRIAVSEFKRGPQWNPPGFSPNDAESYTWHYARESGKEPGSGRGTSGPRWKSDGALPPGSSFTLDFVLHRTLPPTIQRKFDQALRTFLCLGSLGLRATRGLGAIHCIEANWLDSQLAILRESGFQVARRTNPTSFPTWEAALKDWSAWLRYKLRSQTKAESFSALGGINPRQTSAIRFRAIRTADGKFSWLAFEAPHEKILERKTRPLLTPDIFTGSTPQPPPRARR